ncbi:MAG: hypothetical protein SOU49_05905 [Sodaliphilus pleomorphus]|uniref:hypothetical protein n=1 Tax=Sodaliphilus pleomorphus TaxID=2606626 RepID=UPI002A75A974|nr:hypothetical protein [Sodaliphilus pleomorphus]MDY2832260.1 hypothetical protein [Sodaliphilus pleomorphus]
MFKRLAFISLVCMMFTSCGFLKSYTAKYDVSLATVESPADARAQFGETKVASFTDGQINKYRYEDDYIDIVWYVSSTQFNFDLKNKSNHTIKINWDDISYVDCEGKTGRVMHSGVKYNERNNSQPASTIPKGASLSDILLPTDNVYFTSGKYGGWNERLLIPSIYQNQEAFAKEASSYVGKTMKILMPIMIENVQNDYTFEFTINSLLNPELGVKK